eukprot:6465371-Amphidinium_carterae.1
MFSLCYWDGAAQHKLGGRSNHRSACIEMLQSRWESAPDSYAQHDFGCRWSRWQAALPVHLILSGPCAAITSSQKNTNSCMAWQASSSTDCCCLFSVGVSLN